MPMHFTSRLIAGGGAVFDARPFFSFADFDDREVLGMAHTFI